jgi:signal transduction histidine kinase/CheY-like chemotaxis protein
MLQKLTIRAKLILIAFVTSLTALVVTGIAFVFVDRDISSADLERSTMSHAHILAGSLATPLAERKIGRLNHLLQGLAFDPIMQNAVVYDRQGSMLASYRKPEADNVIPLRMPALGSTRTRDSIGVVVSVRSTERIVGRLWLEVDTKGLHRRQGFFLALLLAISAVAALIATASALRLLPLIVRPIHALVRALEDVRTTRNFTLRVPRESDDETGVLTDEFNALLAEIEARDQQMRTVNEQLEVRVIERTTQLESEVNERKRAEAALADANHELHLALSEAKRMAQVAEAASRAKTEFLANISHEIRTPMNGVIGMADLLLDSELSQDQRDYAGTIRRSADNLLVIINDLLDFSKAEAGKMTVEEIPFDLRDIIEDVAELFSQRAAEKNLEVVVSISHNLPAELLGDPGRIRQVLSNLVSNAIKFTERGEIVIEAAVPKFENDCAEIVLSVKDTGVGIPPDRQQAVFESFTQADGSTTRKFGGTGLGLTISRQLIELMDGTLTVESAVGVGSTFSARIKLPVSQHQKSVRPRELRGLHVLVVDDNETNRKILREQLRSWGADATCVASGQQGIEELSARHGAGDAFQLVIMDMQMPDLDGEQTTRVIRADERFKHVPIVLLSSIGARFSEDELVRKGFAAGLTKPVRQSALYNALLGVIAGSRTVQPSASPMGELEFTGIRVLLVEDNPINQKVATQLLRRLGCTVDVADHGRQALERMNGHHYDLVLMDVQMPIMDGFEATAKIREIEGTGRHTIIVAMTANAMSGDRDRCLEAGMDDYLPKPVKPAEITSMLKRWLFTTEDEVSLAIKSEPREPDWDFEQLSQTCGGDPEFMREVLEEYVRTLPTALDRIRGALERKD